MTPIIRMIVLAVLVTAIIVGLDSVFGISVVAKMLAIICVPILTVGWELLKVYLEFREDKKTSDDVFFERYNDIENRLIRCETTLSLLKAGELIELSRRLENRIEQIEIGIEIENIETILSEKQSTIEARKAQEY